MSNIFKPGKITFVLDGGAGSSGKGLRAANIWKHQRSTHTKFVVNTFMSNAAHTVFDENGVEHVYQCLASITHMPDSYEKQYLSPGCVWSKDEILGEINKYKMTPEKLGINPNAVIVTQKDIDYEAGRCDFEGNPTSTESVNLKIGSTLHGVGAARARRILRRPDVVLAKHIPELEPFLCDTSAEIMQRLSNGESGLMEIAQGYQLSLMSEFYPRTTSRNCTVAASLDDAMLPISVAGPVVLNFRTFPIRVNSNKYVRISDGKILTWDEFNACPKHDSKIIIGDSGNCYPDQYEMSWEHISKLAGKEIFEKTSLTKLPRRVFTFSGMNLRDAMLHNNTGFPMYISVNFMNYVDAEVEGKRTIDEVLTPKVRSWLATNIVSQENLEHADKYNIAVAGVFIGTYKTIDDSILVDDSQVAIAVGSKV